MRWGVRDEATDDHMTTELCMREIMNCQRLSMGPNFVVSLDWYQNVQRTPTTLQIFTIVVKSVNQPCCEIVFNVNSAKLKTLILIL